MKNILVATDGSEIGNNALIEARELAEALGAKVKIIHVRDRSLISLYAEGYIETEEEAELYESMGKHEEKSAKLLLEDALKVFQDFSGKVNAVSRSGQPAEEIMKEAEKENHDLIIMGHRGVGAVSRAMLGSVANKVLNHSHKKVLIIQ